MPELYLASAWLACGFVFWVSCSLHSGWPSRWHGQSSRELGWDEVLLIYLPVCMIGGPLWWCALLYVRASRAIRG